MLGKSCWVFWPWVRPSIRSHPCKFLASALARAGLFKKKKVTQVDVDLNDNADDKDVNDNDNKNLYFLCIGKVT